MKILALTFGDERCASTHYRLLQYRMLMEAEDISLAYSPAKSFGDWDSLRDYDLVILQKTLLNCSKVSRLARESKRFLYDADDRIWLRPGKPYGLITRLRLTTRLRQICRSADTCMAANGVIAEDLLSHGAAPVVIPMSLDGNVWFPPEKREGPFTIGWTGSPASLQYLEFIRHAMVASQRACPEVRWQIHCGKDPAWEDLNYEHLPYAPGNEPETVRGFDIGLLPLPDGEFAQGKSPIKALQYFASGAKVLASGVGTTVELLDACPSAVNVSPPDAWLDAIKTAVQPSENLRPPDWSARDAFRTHFERNVVFRKLLSILRPKT